MRNVECGMGNCYERSLATRGSPLHSALRIPHSAFGWLALPALVAAAAPMTAQQWPVHSLDRPRPPVVDPGPERPPVPPPSDAIVLFDGKDLSQWRSPDGTPAKWVVRDGDVEGAPGTGQIITARGVGGIQLHIEGATPSPPKGEGQERGNSGVVPMSRHETQ